MNTEQAIAFLSGRVAGLTERVEAMEKRFRAYELAMPDKKPPMPKSAKAVQRQEAIEVYDQKWREIRERWPALKVHPRSLEAFENNAMALKGEPSLGAVAAIAGRLSANAYYKNPELQALGFSKEEATAWTFFLRLAGFANYIQGKGLILI